MNAEPTTFNAVDTAKGRCIDVHSYMEQDTVVFGFGPDARFTFDKAKKYSGDVETHVKCMEVDRKTRLHPQDDATGARERRDGRVIPQEQQADRDPRFLLLLRVRSLKRGDCTSVRSSPTAGTAAALNAPSTPPLVAAPAVPNTRKDSW